MKFLTLFAVCVLCCLVQDSVGTSQLPILGLVAGKALVTAKVVKVGLLKAGGLGLLHSGVKSLSVPSISVSPSISVAPTVPAVPAIVHYR